MTPTNPTPERLEDDSSLRSDDAAAHPALLPCPFCGGEAAYRLIGNEATASRATEIKCPACNCTMRVGAIRNTLDWTRQTATAAWNRRAPATTEAGADGEAGSEHNSASRIAALEEALRPFANLKLSSIYDDTEDEGYCVYLDHGPKGEFTRQDVIRARRALTPEGEGR